MRKNKKSEEVSKILRDRRLEFLYELHLSNIELDFSRLKELVDTGYIESSDEGNINHIVISKILKSRDNANRQPIADKKLNAYLGKDFDNKKPIEIKADEITDVIHDDNIIAEEELEEGEHEARVEVSEYSGKKEVSRDDWLVLRNSRGEWPEDFCQWIDSLNNGFGNKIEYRPFNLYRQQTKTWIAENSSINDFWDEDSQVRYARIEKARCFESSLYFLNKYHTLKEGEMEGGIH